MYSQQAFQIVNDLSSVNGCYKRDWDRRGCEGMWNICYLEMK